MSRIRILSEHLANQIAAGEVVERPASVVKELVENSLDAGGNQIDVQLEGSGTRMMRIADDGAGMDEDDVLLSIERHATSKLHEESQLNAIATLGFRGEALPSIGSVAKMVILSRPWDRDTGTRAELRYGALHAIHEAGCSKGTVIEVRNLFGNMPARKKFLKSARTEIYHVEEVIKNQALANPQIGFTLQVDNRQTLSFPAGGSLEQRVRDVFRYQGPLLQVSQSSGDTAGSLQLGGYLLLPEAATSRTARLRILVNNRPVHDAMIRHAVMDGLKGFLMKGYQPAGALLLSISPEQVDVNVHPAKREIRFRRAQEVRRDIVAGVARAMQEYQEEVRSDLFLAPQARTEPEIVLQQSTLPTETVNVAEPLDSFAAPGAAPSLQRSALRSPVATSPLTAPSLPKTKTSVFSPPADPDSPAAETYGDLTLVGQILSLYLLCERNSSLVVVDQHAAHERILYGQLRQAYLSGDVPRQQLLFPVTVELGPDHMEVVEKYAGEIESLGLEIEHFGDTTWVIKAVPAVTRKVEPTELLFEVLDGLQGQPGAGLVPEVVEKLMASMACKAAIKAGNRLQPEEMLALLQQMEQSEVFSHCPHGRPVMKTFTDRDIEKWFHRHGG